MAICLQEVSKEDFLQALPSIDECPEDRRDFLIVQKLKLCSIIFTFCGADKDLSPKTTAEMIKENKFSDSEFQNILARQMKTHYLLELSDWIYECKSVDQLGQPIIEMIQMNLFTSISNQEDSEIDPSWTHLQLIYELLMRFIIKSDRQSLANVLDKKFISNIIISFNKKDIRIRNYLKTILYLIYSKLKKMRSFIRTFLTNMLYQFIYENQNIRGIAQILQFIKRIIGKFSTPLKKEHKKFLRNVLIPLHKVNTLHEFSKELMGCVVEMVHKDSSLGCFVVIGILKYWPVTSSQKEIIFLIELKAVLGLMTRKEFEKIIEPLIQRIAITMCSDHSHIAQNSLELWVNDAVLPFIFKYRKTLFPLIQPALYKNLNHWNRTIRDFTVETIAALQNMDLHLYSECFKHFQSLETKKEIENNRQQKWKKIHALCSSVLG